MGHTNLFTEDVKGDYAESMTEFLTASTLSALSGVRHGFFTKNCGNVGFSWAENTAEALESRRRIAVHLGVDSLNLLICRQIHSPDVVCVTKNWRRSDRPEADALVTNKTGIALGILTADCVPVLFADAENGVIGAAHAGWKGAVSGVLENTLAAMEKLGARAGLCRDCPRDFHRALRRAESVPLRRLDRAFGRGQYFSGAKGRCCRDWKYDSTGGAKLRPACFSGSVRG